MTQIGIGQLKHAKTGQTSASLKKEEKRPPLSKQKREQKLPTEGQLSVDILQTGEEMLILCPIAGVKKGDVKVAIQDDVLTIRGERRPVEESNGKQTLVKELFWGPFSRSIVLPDHIDRKNIQARIHEHILIIRIPKTEDFKTRIIHINDTE